MASNIAKLLMNNFQVMIMYSNHLVNAIYCDGCNICQILTKGTYFYDLHKPKFDTVSVIKDLVEGKIQRVIHNFFVFDCLLEHEIRQHY